MADQETTERILDIKVNYEDAIGAIQTYTRQIELARKAEKDLNKQLKEGTISKKEYNEEYTKAEKMIRANKDVIAQLSKEVQNNIRIENENIGSLKQLRAELSALNAKYDELSKEERESELGRNMAKQIKALSSEIKGAEEGTDRFQRSVGSYEEAIKNASLANIPFVGQLQALTKNSGGVVTGLKAITAAALKFIATPIGAVLTALVAVFKAFRAGISSSEENTAKFQQALAPFKVILDAVLNVVQKLVGAVLDFVNAINSGIGAVMDFLGVNTKLNEQIKEGIQLEKQKLELDKDQRKRNEESKKTELEVSELRNKVAQRDKYSAEQRIAFLDEAIKKEIENAEKNKKIAEDRLKILEAEAARAENTAEIEEKLSQARIAVTQATIDLNTKTREMNSQRSETINQMKTENKAEQEAAKQREQKAKENRTKEIEAIRQAEDAMLATLKDGIEKQRKEINLSYDRQIEDLKKRLSEEKDLTQKAREAINQTVVALEKQRQNDLNTLSNEEIQKQISNEQRRIELMLATVKEGSEKEFELRKQQLELQMNAELSNTEITEQEKQLIRDKYAKQESELVVQRQQEIANKQAEAVRLEFENRIAEAKLQGEDELQIKLELRKQELDNLHQLEGESNEEFRARQLEAEQAYVDAKEEISNREIDIQQKKANALATIAGNLSDLIEQAAGDNEAMAELAKVLAIAEVSIAQGVAIAQAVKTATKSSATWIDMLAAIGTVVGAVTAVMATAMKSIKSAKFATGGIFNGDGYVSGPGSGTSDSINARLSNGESVITARATSMFAPLLSAMNVAGGGVPISVTVDNNQQIGEDMLARAFAKGASSLPNPVVSVSEIDTVNNRVETLENLGTA